VPSAGVSRKIRSGAASALRGSQTPVLRTAGGVAWADRSSADLSSRSSRITLCGTMGAFDRTLPSSLSTVSADRALRALPASVALNASIRRSSGALLRAISSRLSRSSMISTTFDRSIESAAPSRDWVTPGLSQITASAEKVRARSPNGANMAVRSALIRRNARVMRSPSIARSERSRPGAEAGSGSGASLLIGTPAFAFAGTRSAPRPHRRWSGSVRRTGFR
jgi:hypothetical protein